jgi:hypothetical protein
VMWLNERDLDIRCVRLTPYQFMGKTLLDIQQVLPLPEAAEYQIRLKKKAAEERKSQEGGADWTRYDLKVGELTFPKLYTWAARKIDRGRISKAGVRHENPQWGRIRPSKVLCR